MSDVRAIPIELIVLHDDTQPRVKFTQEEIAADYARMMVEGAEFPPVDVFFDGEEYWLADGYHRLMAAESLGWTEVDCTVHAGDLADAIWFSCSVNATHGLRRTREDVQLAIERALTHPKSASLTDRQIARHVGCSHPTVMAARQRMVATGKIYQSQSRVDDNGVERVLPAKPEPPPPASEPEQIDLEDFIAAAVRTETPVPPPPPVATPSFNQTYWYLATHLANTMREQRKLPDPRTVAMNFPRSQSAALSLEDAEHMAAWWAEFLPLWRGRQEEFRQYLERLNARLDERIREMNDVA
jgi:hypothetical protein